jgi:hypothetical protein
MRGEIRLAIDGIKGGCIATGDKPDRKIGISPDCTGAA